MVWRRATTLAARILVAFYERSRPDFGWRWMLARWALITGSAGAGCRHARPTLSISLVREGSRLKNNFTTTVTVPAAWRCSPRSFAIRFAERSTKLFDEFVSHLQIGKAPAIIMLAFRQNCTSVSRLNMSCLVKLNDPATQYDIQPVDTDGKLGDVGVLSFVPRRLKAVTRRHV